MVVRASAAQTSQREQPAVRLQKARGDINVLLCAADKGRSMAEGVLFDYRHFTGSSWGSAMINSLIGRQLRWSFW